ncbi:MAG: fasciclin domain-containing protein [Cyanobacteria bacterium SZAS LIN-2]|nr:fasciclin domain-containing protein [Cyanobacteria bacterium SZAS LIN-2]
MANGIVGVAAKNKDLSTTVSAIKKAGLVCALSGAGPLTVFAPTNEGWAKMPKDMREGLLNDPKRLKDVLTYHVVKGKYDAAALDGKRSITTLEGQSLMLDNKDGKLIVDGCIVTTPDIKASNGMIHMIDAVAVPERGK